MKMRYVAWCAILVAVASAMAAAAENKAPAEDQQAKLIAVLQSDAPAAEKAITCKRLAIYGRKEAVPALVPLVLDEKFSSWARTALEAIPDPAAGEALRQAMGKTQGRLLIGVINSIGVRRDAGAAEDLAAKLKDSDADVAAAAAIALGRIGGPAATAALEQALAAVPAATRGAIAQGCVLAAEKLLAGGKSSEAAKLYDTIRKADVPKPRVLEATRGAILARGASGVPLLVEQLQAADKAGFRLGLQVARELPGREVTDALVAELGRAAPERQEWLVAALADRGDATVLPSVLQVAKSGPQKARLAAIRVLGHLGNGSCVPALMEAATDDDAGLSQTALGVLAELPGKEVSDGLAARLLKAEGKERKVLIQLVGLRRIESAAAGLLKAADDPDAQVRAAALTALGSVIAMGDLPQLIARVAHPKDAEETKVTMAALRAACVRMPDREACAATLVEAMAKAPMPAQCAFLEILSLMGGSKALEAVAAAAKDGKTDVQDTASRVLGEWMTADAAPVLLDLAKTAADEKYKIRALRGYIRIARQINLTPAQRIAMCQEAAKVCQRDEEKKLVLEVLRRNPCAAGLTLAVAQLSGAGTKAEASTTAVAIAEKIVQKEPAAVATAMKQVIEAGGDRTATARAKTLLSQATRRAPSKK